MTIIRAQRSDRFVILPNETVDDDRLSFRARGILAWILSKPDHWRTNATSIARAGKEGREAVRTALRELQEHGYLMREKVQGDDGRWSTITYVYDVPHTPEAQESAPGSDVPETGHKHSETGSSVSETGRRETGRRETGRYSKNLKARTERDTSPLSPPPEPNPSTPADSASTDAGERPYDGSALFEEPPPDPPKLDPMERFDEFWDAYGHKIDKMKCEALWQKAVKDTDPQTIIDAATRWRAAHVAADKVKFMRGPARWLRGEQWNDEDVPEWLASERHRASEKPGFMGDETRDLPNGAVDPEEWITP